MNLGPFTRGGLRKANTPAQQGISPLDKWMTGLCALHYAEQSPAVLYGAVGWKRTVCLFLSNCHAIQQMEWIPPSVCFWWTGQDWMAADTYVRTSAAS